MKFVYQFPVVRGIQAKREYYIAMVPINMMDRLFPAEEEYIPPEFRAQRKISLNRIPAIHNYILNNRSSYVFSALAASIDGQFEFKPINDSDIGTLEVSMDAHFLINDGQHRKAALLEAIKEDESLGNETIPIVFFADQGLNRSQQMFTDLNKYAVKTSNSIAELYDSRDPLAVITRNIINSVPFLNEYVDKERDMLGKYSSKLFTLNNFYTANKRIVGKAIEENTEEKLSEYWRSVVHNMEPWNELQMRTLTKIDLRENYIASQAVVIQALGRVGAYFYAGNNQKLKDHIHNLKDVNWKRSNPEWHARVIRDNGRMINSERAIILGANVIKKALNIKLSKEEEMREIEFSHINSM